MHFLWDCALDSLLLRLKALTYRLKQPRFFVAIFLLDLGFQIRFYLLKFSQGL